MKKIILLFVLAFCTFPSLSFSQGQNYVDFSPTSLSLVVNSGNVVQGQVWAIRVGSAQIPVSYSIQTVSIPDTGFLGVSPSSGSLFPASNQVINFTFSRNVTSTTTSFYSFLGRSGNFVRQINISVTYLAPSCPSSLNITTNVSSGQTDNQSAQNTITATNEIASGATANYDAGTRVTLSPGFRAKSGSTFRAFIDGCTPGSSRGSLASKSLNDADILIDEVGEESEHLNVKIYPNPVTNYFTIESQDKIQAYRIFNRYGKQVSKKQVNATKWEVQMNTLPRGFYYLEIITEKGEIARKKIIKN